MANTTMNISLPEQMRDWVELQIDSGDYSNNSDYVRDLIRQDKNKKEKLIAMQTAVNEGLASGSAGKLDINQIKEKAKRRMSR